MDSDTAGRQRIYFAWWVGTQHLLACGLHHQPPPFTQLGGQLYRLSVSICRNSVSVGLTEIRGLQVAHSPIDTNDLPGDEIGQVGSEKFDHFGAVLRLPQPSHGNMR